MKEETFTIPLSFSQILGLVKQLPIKEKIRLSKELEKDTINKQLTKILKSLRTDELSVNLIDSEVEKVRAARYANKK